MTHVLMFRDLVPHNFQHLFLWVQISEVLIDTSLGTAFRSDVTNASTAETFSFSFTLPTSFASAWFVTIFSEDFLAVPCVQMVAVFVTQVSHHHWSKTAGMTDDDASLHLRMIWEQMLLCCQFFFQGL